MKLVSSLALAAALVTAAVAVPVSAKEKPAPVAPSPLQDLSKEFRAPAAAVQKALQAKDFAAASAALPAAEAAATKPADKYYAGLFRYQTALGLKDEKGMTVGVLAMLNSGVAPAEQQGSLNLHLGREAYFAKDYAKASAYFAETIRLGKATPDTYILAAETSFAQKQIPAGLALAEQAIAAQKAAGQAAPESWYARAFSVSYNAKMDADAVKWSGLMLKAYPSVTNWRNALILYRNNVSGDAQITLDIYRLMRATKSIAGERDYYDYATIASGRGLPGETKAVVDMAITSDAKLATSKNLAELRAAATPKIAADMAGLPAAEKAAAGAPTGRGAMGTADAYLGYGQDAKAVPMYRLALQKGGIDADAANTRLGIALARSGDKEGARAAFAAVKGQRAGLAALWTLYLDAAPAA